MYNLMLMHRLLTQLRAAGKAGTRLLLLERLKFGLVLSLSLAILGGSSYWGLMHLQRRLHQEMINHDGEVLNAVAQAQQLLNAGQTNLAQSLQQPANQLALVLAASQIQEGVLAVRLYRADGQFVTAFPPTVSEAPLAPGALTQLQQCRPLSRYAPTARLDELFVRDGVSGLATNTTPLLEVNLPIHARGESKVLAAAQLVLDARQLAGELARLDAHLRAQALLVFLVGGTLLAAVLSLAYRRLQRTNSLLRERTARLLRANHELTLAAKTGALGAVTAHLVHGLSNPLAHLQDFISTHSGKSPEDPNWEEAVAAAGRMQQLVHEVVRVLGEERSADRYELSLAELGELLLAKAQPLAQHAGVQLEVRLTTSGQLGNCPANLVLLILENLLHNALQVTPRGKRVQLSISAANSAVLVEVADQGPGFPPHLLGNLFAPCRSTKGGSGIGLAISQQLASHLGAELTLKKTDAQGCVFALLLPRAIFGGAPQATPHEESALEGETAPVPALAPLCAKSPAGVGQVLLLALALCLSVPSHLWAWTLPPKWRWSNPGPHGADIFDQANAGGTYVQVGERGQIFTSTDLASWVPRESHTTVSLRAVTFFGGRVVITGESGTVLLSDDAIDYRLLSLGTTDWLVGLAASSNLVVAVGDNGAIYTSTNAVDWSRRSVAFTTWLSSVACGLNTFVAVGEQGFVATSPDGITWQLGSSGTTANLNWVEWVGSQFLAVGDGGKVFSSATGSSWQPVSTGATNALYGVSGSALSGLVAGASELRLQTSGTWSNQLSGTLAAPAPTWPYYTAGWDGSNYLAAGASGLLAIGNTVTNTTAWSTDTNSVRSWLWGVTRAGDHYLAVGNNGTLLSSPNGIDWDVELTPSSATNSVFLGAGGSTGLFLAVGSKGTVLWGTNVFLWNALSPRPTTNDLEGVCYDGYQYLLCGGNGTLLSSQNGTNWTQRTTSTTSFLSSLNLYPNGYVCAGSDGVVLTSTNSLTWTRRTSGTTNWLSQARYLNGHLVAVGEKGTILTSADAVTWTPRTSGTTNWLNDVAFFQGAWFVVGNQGTVLISTNLTDWVSTGTITGKSLYGLTIYQNQLVMVGAEGVVIRSQLIPATTPANIGSYSRKSGTDVFLFYGQPDQQFFLDNSASFPSWAQGPLLEFYDSTGTLLFLSSSTNSAAQQFFRTSLAN